MRLLATAMLILTLGACGDDDGGTMHTPDTGVHTESTIQLDE